ncbi:DUF3048 domain-containing protein [Patescibacteria group bacterium]|nr:DUF3048 domain-containing protein [Patescibacteria group bacterium]
MVSDIKKVEPKIEKAVKDNWLKKLGRKLKTDRKTQIIFIVVVAVLAAGSVLGYYAVSDGNLKFTDLQKREKTEDDSGMKARRLDGVMVESAEADNWPVAVMIENITTVRPQSGLSDANVVYEALAEGGIARFMAIFDKGGTAAKIGPVRSARSYYLEWLSEYDALYVFSGAYPPVLSAVEGLEIKNINAMYSGSQYYWRDNEASAPHNMFTNAEKLSFALRDQELDQKKASFKSWKFEDEVEKADRFAGEQEIKIDFSSDGYKVVYKYDRESNTYLRYNPEGAEHTDRNTGKQIAPKNIVVIRVPNKVIDDQGRLEMDVHGEGEAVMFANGEATKGTWKKKDRTDRTVFYDEGGKEYSLVRGQTWVEVVPPERSVTY